VKPTAAALSGLATRTAQVAFAKTDLLESHRDNRMYEWPNAQSILLGFM
jgi:hypothetical protein